MKKIILFLVLAIAAFLPTVHANDNRIDNPAVRRSGYIPAPFDYVLPQAWSTYVISYPDWSWSTGHPSPYSTYYYWVNRRCQVMNLVTISGQLYATINFVGTTYTVLWPVNYVSPYGGVDDYLIKTT